MSEESAWLIVLIDLILKVRFIKSHPAYFLESFLLHIFKIYFMNQLTIIFYVFDMKLTVFAITIIQIILRALYDFNHFI